LKTKIPNKVNVITLGCSKNLVDSEYLLKQLSANGFKVVHDSNSADSDIIVINTCGFINDAKQESIETILQFEELKKQKKIKKLFVFGCLSERYKDELIKEIPGVDQFFGVYNLKELVESIGANYKSELIGERLVTTPKHFAYLKISDGCDRNCSFCAIPLIKGKHISKAIPELVDEAELLVRNGAKEIILIAQDLSYYGYDIYKKPKLAELLDQLSDIKGLKWLRLHYAYPSKFPLDVLDVIKKKPTICHYLDIPVQHISDKMLKLMKRGNTKEQTYNLIDTIKSKVPDIALRTTILVGHPGETDEDFKELLDFVKFVKFDRLGVFTYSEEENTFSANNYKDEIPFAIKQSRMDEIMEVQRQISNKLNYKKIDNIYKAIIDRKEGDYYIGRTEYDSPEVDNEVLIKSDVKLKIGQFYNVRIIKADDFDLYARIEK